MYLDEIVVFLFDKFDVHVFRYIISRALDCIRLIYKKIENVSDAQKNDLRTR